MQFVQVTPGAAWLNGRRAFLHLLAEAADALGGRLELEAEFGHVGRFHAASGETRPIFGNALGLNPDSAAQLAADKDYTARLLAGQGIAVPRGMVLFSEAYRARMALKNRRVAAALPTTAEGEAFAERHGYPVIVKPNVGSEGRGVHRPANLSELRGDLAALFLSDDRIRLEECVPGIDTRLTVLDGAVRLAYRRLPPAVTGDGRQALERLVAHELRRLAAEHRGPKLSAEDPRIVRALARQGWTYASVPPPGTVVRLLDSANLSSGGHMEDLTGRLPPEAEALAVKATAALGLRLAGVDILSTDLTKGLAGACVLEVNASPGLDYYAHHGPGQWDRARALVTDVLRSQTR
ncbi:MAG: ATP-dependent carboxylate-amine ligase [Pseudomonadota bacterium]